MGKITTDPGSFRDPCGFVFRHEGEVYRYVGAAYAPHYDALLSSGLYDTLVQSGLLVEHEEVEPWDEETRSAYRILRPRQIPFISYPYEWCPSQLRDAARATLRVQQMAMDKGMVLKDSSAYNIQFLAGKPVLIDTLSFERYEEGSAWVGYRQFCQHFLAPLALMHFGDVRLGHLLKLHIDGIPLDLAARLLPLRARFRPSLLVHLFLHAASQRACADVGGGRGEAARRRRVSRMGLLGLLDGLDGAVKKLTPGKGAGVWHDYYDATNYSDTAFEQKKSLVDDFLERTGARVVWDLGANTGVFSRLTSDKGMLTVSMDFDPLCVERNYRDAVARGDGNLLPLVMDLCNPSPSLGWHHTERKSLLSRAPADAAMALALLHHLAIGNNVPLVSVARFFGELCRSLIVEFVPKQDSQVQRLLATREDIFPDYNVAGFEEAFSEVFTIEASVPIKETERTLYLMRLKA